VLKAAFLCALACLIGVIGSAELNAGQERYDYDALGRLVRVIDEQGHVTEYVYDAAGNILQVITGGTAQPPAITSIDTNSIRRGETTQVTIAGSGLTNVSVSTSDAGLDVSSIRFTATQISFSLTAAFAASLGVQRIRVSNAAGAASASVTVNPALPRLDMSPQPIAVPPDNVARNFFVTLSNIDNVDHVVALASANSAVAAVSPASVTIPAGQTQVLANVTGKAVGTTFVNLSAAGLASTSFPVFVTVEFTGVRTSFAQPLGVVRQSAGSTGTPRLFASRSVGLVKGSYIDSVAPGVFVVGTGPSNLVINGNELAGVSAVSITPPDGLTLGTFTIAADGRSITVPVTVATNAPTTVRKVVLAGAQQPYVPARAGADQIRVALPPADIFSIDPFFATVGTTAMTLTIRGRNLQSIQAVTLTPGTGITVDAVPTASADGTTATVRLSIAQNAPTSDRVVRAITPGGASDPTATPANTFKVVNEIQTVFTPISSPAVGVVLQDVPPPPSFNTFSSLVGVTVGSVVTSLAPAVGVIGQTTSITIGGNELQGVTSVQLSPPDGVTMGAPSIGPDGKTVTVSTAIALSAPQTLRAVRVLAGTANVPFSSPTTSQFRVSAPLAALDSITPNFLQTGAPASTMTIRGRNFQNASAVGVSPPDAISISNPPTVDSSGTQITVLLSAAAAAATGPRAVTVTTPAGTSSDALTPANTLTITNAAGPAITPVTSAPLGVVLQDGTPPPPVSVGPIAAPAVGVLLQDPNPPVAPATFATASNLGVAVGPVATGAFASPLSPGASGTLTVFGFALNDVTGVTIVPSTSITLGGLSVAPDGSQVSVPITVQAGAAAGLRGVNVFRGTAQVQFAPPGTNTFGIGVGVPGIDSISPILASRGQTITLTVHGHNFQGATAVTATPGAGLFIDGSPAVSADGTTITLRIGIDANAALGANVIRVFTPAGATTDAADPSNTFTVQP